MCSKHWLSLTDTDYLWHTQTVWDKHRLLYVTEIYWPSAEWDCMSQRFTISTIKYFIWQTQTVSDNYRLAVTDTHPRCDRHRLPQTDTESTKKNPAYGRHWLSQRVWIETLCQKTKLNIWVPFEHLPSSMPDWSRTEREDEPWVQSWTPPFFCSLRGQSTSPIRNTSLFLRLHAGTINESNAEHLLVFKAPCGDDQGVQSGTPSCF